MMENLHINRCHWCNLNNPLYIKYHDKEWGVPVHDERKLFEMLLLESFQAGLSWECVLNKREAFREAFDEFNYEKVAQYDNDKIEQLTATPGIIRHKLKIKAAITNAIIFIKIQKEYGSFDRYIWHFTEGKTFYENHKTTSPLSDSISKELRKQGMKFVGSTIVYSYLQAIGIINSHEVGCYLYDKSLQERLLR